MEFLKLDQLELNPAGYLVSKESGKPVKHQTFVNQQKAADYIVKLSEAVKGKTFKINAVDNLEAIKAEVLAAMNASEVRTYVANPKEPKSKTKEELTQHALDFAKYLEEKEGINSINVIMQNYNSINDIETVGDYFEEGLVKLQKIYNTKEILAAVKLYTETVG